MSNTFTASRGVNAHEMNRITGAIDGTYIFPSTAGGAVTPSSGMTIAVAAIAANVVTINGSLETTAYAGGTVNVGAADATNPRRDLVYYDTSGAVGVSAGTAAAIPHVPTLTSTQIAVAEIYVAANDTSIDSGDIIDRRQGVGGTPLDSVAQTFVETGKYKQFFALGPPASISGAGTYATGTAVGLGFEVIFDASGTVDGADGGDADSEVGAWLFTASSTSGSDAGVIGPESLYTNDLTLVWRGKFPSNAALGCAFVGIKTMTGGTFADGNNLIGFRVLTTGNVIGVCDSSGTETTRDTGAVGTTEMTLRIEIRSAGTIVRFYKDNVQVGADVTTNIPTFAALSVAAGLVNNTTTSLIMHTHDLFGWREV